MAKKITKIPATLNRFNLEPVVAIRKRRVAGYARVSTDRDEQATSYEAQMAYYKAYIENREDWEFVGMYSDEGISATNTKKRDGFKQMIEDALAGKIDLIITKSVSRFARNTVDSLSTIRKLKEKGVEVYFEKENIWTLDAKGEMLLTIMSSFAQEAGAFLRIPLGARENSLLMEKERWLTVDSSGMIRILKSMKKRRKSSG